MTSASRNSRERPATGTTSPGEPLARYLARTGRLPVLQGLALAVQLLNAVDTLHRWGLVHGGITPDDLSISRTGRLTLPGPGGQGAATFHRQGPYTPPEQDTALRIDHRSDLFAAAVVTYELLTGALPFDANGADDVWLGRRAESPRPVRAFREDLPAGLDAVFARALARRPDDRYQTAGELSAALQQAIPAPRWTRPALDVAQPRPEPPPQASPTEEVAAPAAPAQLRPMHAPASAGAIWQLGLALAVWGAVALTAATLIRGAPAGLPANDRGVPVELAGHASGPSLGAGPLGRAGSLQPVPSSPASALVAAPSANPRGAAGAVPPGGTPTAPPPARLVVTQQAFAADAEPRRPDNNRADNQRRDSGRPRAHAAARAVPVRHTPVPVASPGPPSPRAACARDLAAAPELCTAFRCATAEFRHHPVCVRMHAEGAIARARLAEAHGGP